MITQFCKYGQARQCQYYTCFRNAQTQLTALEVATKKHIANYHACNNSCYAIPGTYDAPPFCRRYQQLHDPETTHLLDTPPQSISLERTLVDETCDPCHGLRKCAYELEGRLSFLDAAFVARSLCYEHRVDAQRVHRKLLDKTYGLARSQRNIATSSLKPAGGNPAAEE
ncbi:uncharacterized protein MYCGRDRAFT_104874 [Zymoseptoria tritici IPO323]|uniref:Uncharacterized protein n=1 Tax=Zymoseptoria tritici (strain CBS 115943 / IPO323) TaxID=336722 RepID=F9XDH3_ZYMTI|nr:uncharacterized protein MYCGRDRAFT_104874 [Zymoseptoria tritici IPO323]EGP86800.1 hypothetical protein MYCGRDRAFT_104874 [Zymoseptoria tritici IPO323]